MKTSTKCSNKKDKLHQTDAQRNKKKITDKHRIHMKNIQTNKINKFKNLNDKQKLIHNESEDSIEDMMHQKENRKHTDKIKTETSNICISDESSSMEVLKMLRNVKERKLKQKNMGNKQNKQLMIKMKQMVQNKNNSINEKLIELKQNQSLSLKRKNKFYKKLRKNLEDINKVKKPVASLRTKMMEKLKAARFRFLNEQIYTINSKETQKIFKTDPDAFKAYHEGYRNQVKKWPVNPVNIIIKGIKKMPNWHKIADLGCGDAQIAKSVEQQVYSFDLVAVDESVTACDMANIPLESDSVDVVIFCLSLMGTNLNDYIMEANRILKTEGVLKIAEVESRFENIDEFIKNFQKFGFRNVWRDLSYNLFYFLDFTKVHNIKNKNKLPTLNLLPCLYKKR